MAPRLTDAEADDLAVKALMAMAVDEYRTDLRAQVAALLSPSLFLASDVDENRARKAGVRQVLEIIDNGSE